MAHQTGIEPSAELMQVISKALKGSYRYLQVKIEKEELVPSNHEEPQGSWEDDLDVMIQPLLEEKCPCYVFYRLDTYNIHQNYLWIFMSYTPDFSPVKLKMLYAATKASLKKSFDNSAIVDEIAATAKDELSLQGYRKHEESKKAPPPRTVSEMEALETQQYEGNSDIGTSTKQSHMHGLSFPVQPDALNALSQFKDKSVSYVQLSIDTKKETINLEVAQANVEVDALFSLIPDVSPRYHLFRFEHTHEGDFQEATVFLYSCPGFKSSIKERMLYSSCKEPCISEVEQELGTEITKRIEIGDGSEINEEFMMDEVHPKKTIVKQKFLKPKGPNRRPKSPGRAQGSVSPVNGD